MRFPEFSGEWDRIKVSDLLEFYPTNSLSWEQLDYSDKGVFNLHYGLIHKGLPTQVDVSENSLPTIKEEYIPKKMSLCQNGDIAFADASEDTNDVAKCIEFANCEGQKIVCGLHTIHGRDTQNKTITGYKGYAFSARAFREQIRRLAQGTKIYSISSGNFSECYIGIPTKAEQNKIASLLLAVDQRIATQIKIIEDLKKLKSAISNNYLYDKSWPKYKISEIASLGRGRVISSKEISLQQNPRYPVYSSQTSNNGVMGYLDIYDFDGEYITWTTDGANAGTVFYRNGQFNCTNVCGTINVRESFDAYFLSTILQTATARYVSTNLANPKLMNNTMASIVVRIPDIKIQKYWSSILRKMEEKLSIEATILLALQQQKQYLLAQMFI